MLFQLDNIEIIWFKFSSLFLLIGQYRQKSAPKLREQAVIEYLPVLLALPSHKSFDDDRHRMKFNATDRRQRQRRSARHNVRRDLKEFDGAELRHLVTAGICRGGRSYFQ